MTDDDRLRWNPHPAQRRAYQSDARFRAVAAGRRSGKTTLAGYETAARALSADSDWMAAWVTPGHSITETGFRLIDSTLNDQIIADGKQSAPFRHIFDNGARIDYLTTGGNPNVSEGYDWVVIDEAAKGVPKESWVQDLRPTLSNTNGDALFISTPEGGGWFRNWFERGQSPDYPDVDSFQWTSYDAPHIPDDEVDAARQELPERIFRQEYLAEFLDESGGVFSDLDDRLFTVDGELAEIDSTEPYAHGWDLARHEDYLVGIVVDANGRVVDYHRSQGDSWPGIQSRIERAAAEYPGLVGVDASRDNKVVADLSESIGHSRVEPIKFSPKRKRQLIEDLTATIEAGELSAPDIPQLRHELSIFEYDVTAAGSVRYHAPEGFHDDTVDALAMAADQLDRLGAVKSRRSRDSTGSSLIV